MERKNIAFGRTFKQIFKTIEEHNNLWELHLMDRDLSVYVYIDDSFQYKCYNYKEFERKIKKEFIPEFADRILDSMICGDTYEFEFNGRRHRINTFII